MGFSLPGSSEVAGAGAKGFRGSLRGIYKGSKRVLRVLYRGFIRLRAGVIRSRQTKAVGERCDCIGFRVEGSG